MKRPCMFCNSFSRFHAHVIYTFLIPCYRYRGWVSKQAFLVFCSIWDNSFKKFIFFNNILHDAPDSMFCSRVSERANV